MDYKRGDAYKQQQEKFVQNLKKFIMKNILPLLLKNFDCEQNIKVFEYESGLGIMADILYKTYQIVY